MNLENHPIGVCSWSLKTSGPAELISAVQSLGLQHVQLALGPLIDSAERERAAAMELIRSSGIQLTAGMIGFVGENYSSLETIRRTGGIVPDALWDDRRARAIAAGELAARMGIVAVSFHLGFIPARSSPAYATLKFRAADISAAYQSLGVSLLMETGQESAAALLDFLHDVAAANLAVNFDPANVILYGAGDPIAALRTLGKHVRHVHFKDAIASDQPGVTWGRETRFGDGEVNASAFLQTLDEIGYAGPLVIECEFEKTHAAALASVRAGIETIRRICGNQ